MGNFVEYVEWVLLMHRVRRDPAKFIERAAWHLWPDYGGTRRSAFSLMLAAARFVAQGAEVPAWLFR